MHSTEKLIFASIILMILFAKVNLYGIDFLDEPDNHRKIFHIERSRDSDIVQYAVNLDTDGKLNRKEPIRVYWIKHTMDADEVPLTPIQKKRGYGIHIIDQTEHEIKFHIVSFKKQVFTVQTNQQGLIKCHTNCQGSQVEPSKLFIQFKGDSYWLPVVKRIDLFGFEAENETKLISYYPKNSHYR